MLKGKTVVLGITGGIAAYKSCEIVSRLVKLSASVHVIMTKNAQEFVSKLTFETLSNNRVVTDTFDRDFTWEVEHVSLAKRADIFVIAPATANFIGKTAAGIADDFLTTTVMAARSPVLIAPAMNTAMLDSAANIANMKTLSERGYLFIEPGAGRLACGDIGRGRMSEPSEIVEAIISILLPKRDYVGKTVIVTAGATMEAIDPARMITNRSSGKMGAALARALMRRGANVRFIAANMTVPVPTGVESAERVTTTTQMLDAAVSSYKDADMLIMAAAPCDYRPLKFSGNKLKSESLTLELVKNPDIAKTLGQNKGDKKLVIFSAETEELVANAANKKRSKFADMVVANNILEEGAGFDTDTNRVTIITDEETFNTQLLSKDDIADIILDKAVKLF